MSPEDRSRYLTFDARPALRQPIMIVAFEGWNDAAEAASSALEFLIEHWHAPRFASIDPEEFYDFTETRPEVSLGANDQREIDWPANEFFYYCDARRAHDLILLAGVEPQLRWRTFTNTILDVAREFNVSAIVSLGALLADVSHSRPARVSVTATDEALRKKVRKGVERGSRYEGPTGIVGVLHEACRAAGINGASLWAHAPHYLSASPNPHVTLGVLRRLDDLLDLQLDLHEPREEADKFLAEVNEAVEHDPEATSYIHMLEAQDDEEADDDSDRERDNEDRDLFRRPRPGSGPTGGGLIQDVEEFLRRRRGREEKD